MMYSSKEFGMLKELEERRKLLLVRIEPLWSDNPVWKEISFNYGWDGLLSDTLDMLEGQNFKIVQLKEKFGAGRFYVDHEHDEFCNYKEKDPTTNCGWWHPKCKVQTAIDWFETGTQYICEGCGVYSRLTSTSGWYSNMCTNCTEVTDRWNKYYR